MTSLSAKGLDLLHKIEAVYVEVRRQESNAFQAAKQNEILVASEERVHVNEIEESILEESEPWSARCELLMKENKELKCRNERLQVMYRSKEASNAHLTEKLKRTAAVSDALQKEKETQFNECLVKWSDTLKIDGLLKAISRETESYRTTVGKIQELFVLQENQAGKLKDDMISLTKTNNLLTAANSAQTQALEDWRRKWEVVLKENTELKASNMKLSTLATTSQTQFREKEDRINELTTLCKALQAEVQQERRSKEAAQIRASDAENQIDEMNKAIQTTAELMNRRMKDVKPIAVQPAPPSAATAVDLTVLTTAPTPASPTATTEPSQQHQSISQSLPADPIYTQQSATQDSALPQKRALGLGDVSINGDHASLSKKVRAGCSEGDTISPQMAGVANAVSTSPLVFQKKTGITKSIVMSQRGTSSSAAPAPLPSTTVAEVSNGRTAVDTTGTGGMECGACGKSHSESTMMKCQGCQRGFHSVCKKKMLKDRMNISNCSVVTMTTNSSDFLCDQCFSSKE